MIVLLVQIRKTALCIIFSPKVSLFFNTEWRQSPLSASLTSEFAENGRGTFGVESAPSISIDTPITLNSDDNDSVVSHVTFYFRAEIDAVSEPDNCIAGSGGIAFLV